MIIDSNQINKEYLKDIVRYRELFFFLSWRDIIVRYKQAFFGIAWALIRPILTMLFFTFLFGRIAHLPSDHVSYPLFVLAGMLPWQLFSNSILDTSLCLLNHSNLITKVYFPRIIIPSAQIIVHLVDFSVGLVLLLLLSLVGKEIHWTICSLPFFIFLTILLCIGGGLWLSALTANYRDVRFIVPFLVQFGMFICPVGYGSFIIPEEWLWGYYLNPMVGIIDGFRWAFFGITHPYLMFSLANSIAITSLILITGFFYFRNTERTLADKI